MTKGLVVSGAKFLGETEANGAEDVYAALWHLGPRGCSVAAAP